MNTLSNIPDYYKIQGCYASFNSRFPGYHQHTPNTSTILLLSGPRHLAPSTIISFKTYSPPRLPHFFTAWIRSYCRKAPPPYCYPAGPVQSVLHFTSQSLLARGAFNEDRVD